MNYDRTMRFIGGPLHGRPVLAQLANPDRFVAVRVSRRDGTTLDVQYARLEWFVLMQEPIVYYGLVGAVAEEIMELARPLLCPPDPLVH